MSDSKEITHSVPEVKPSKGKVFLQRLGSTLALWGVVLLDLLATDSWISTAGLMALVGLISLGGMQEIFRLIRGKGFTLSGSWAMGIGLAWNLSLIFFLARTAGDKGEYFLRLSEVDTFFLVLSLLVVGTRQLSGAKQGRGLEGFAMTLMALLYVPFLLNFISRIWFYPGANGNWYLFYFILVTKFSDMGAYLVGSVIGKNKMIPRISPGKTWEGFGGAIVISMLGSMVFFVLGGNQLPGMTLIHATVLGGLLSLTAVVGDLMESLFKREAGIKDSGKWFPGIGGMLDLVDSILFNAPIVYCYLHFVIRP